jgi:two-component system, LuxR family, sensor kinase FixL
MTESPAGSLRRRYRAALVLIAALVLLHQLLVQPALLRLTSDAPVINMAGRQRMLSQRLAKAALALQREKGETAARRLAELHDVLALWSISHARLRDGAPDLGAQRGNSGLVNAAFAELEPWFVRIRDAASHLEQRGARGQPGDAETRGDLDSILEAEPTYLERMDHIVGLLEREARERVRWMFWAGWIVTGLIWLALAAISRLIVRPALLTIARQVDLLRRGRDELEERVDERTRELENANARHQTLVDQLSHAARTNTIGEMAAGLAHELNQPLGAIANYAEGCLVEIESDRPALADVRTALCKLRDAALRAGKIIDRIRKFVTRHEFRHEPFAPSQVVEQAELILRHEAKQRGVALNLDLAPDLPSLYGDSIQIQQVLVNLIRNALDSLEAAKPESPSVLIQTRRGESAGVDFRVTDNGEGIDAEHVSRVFDAYFSTRAGGMGMGLAISRTIIEAHQGRIAVSSLPGVTTTFHFTLPVGWSRDA